VTKNLSIHGSTTQTENNHFDSYGSDAPFINNLIQQHPEFAEKIHPNFPYQMGEVVWAVRNEMARTVADVLARRLRVLFLDAKVAVEMAPKVAEIIASELSYDKNWESQQVQSFIALASKYRINPNHKPGSEQLN
jgi:glycerol-3-phosphate dehydrogenase